MKQYIVREEDFEALLKALELHKYKGSPQLNHSVMVEAEKERQKILAGELPNGITDRLAGFVMDEAHRTFHYHVYGWIQEMKK